MSELNNLKLELLKAKDKDLKFFLSETIKRIEDPKNHQAPPSVPIRFPAY
jgi:hypothetical protein